EGRCRRLDPARPQGARQGRGPVPRCGARRTGLAAEALGRRVDDGLVREDEPARLLLAASEAPWGVSRRGQPRRLQGDEPNDQRRPLKHEGTPGSLVGSLLASASVVPSPPEPPTGSAVP